MQNSPDYIEEIEQLSTKVAQSAVPSDLKDYAERNVDRLRRMAKMGSYSNDYETISKYIEWITQIPWGVVTQDNLDIKNARNIMDSTHFGMDTVKELILDYLAIMNLKKLNQQPEITPSEPGTEPGDSTGQQPGGDSSGSSTQQPSSGSQQQPNESTE